MGDDKKSKTVKSSLGSTDIRARENPDPKNITRAPVNNVKNEVKLSDEYGSVSELPDPSNIVNPPESDIQNMVKRSADTGKHVTKSKGSN